MHIDKYLDVDDSIELWVTPNAEEAILKSFPGCEYERKEEANGMIYYKFQFTQDIVRKIRSNLMQKILMQKINYN